MIEEENLRRERLAALPPKEDKCFAVFTGIPVIFGDLTEAEEWAAEKTEQDHRDRCILLVPQASFTDGLVARYKGVQLHALKEIQEEKEMT
jgi:hypothetical protein